MKAKRRLETTLEIHETMIIRFGQNQIVMYCQSCQANIPYLSIVQATAILSLSESEICRLLDDKKIHTRENSAGSILLCSKSLAAVA